LADPCIVYIVVFFLKIVTLQLKHFKDS